MTFFDKSLIFKIGAVVLCVEFLVLTPMGLYYSDRFSKEIDRQLESSVQRPGTLMNRQLLRYESIGDTDVMTDLIGEEFEDGMVIGADGRIYYAYNPEQVGKSVFAIPNVNVNILTAHNGPTFFKEIINNKGHIVSITPLAADKGAKPSFYVYIKAETETASIKKKRIVTLFILGAIFCILFTSLVIIAYSRQQVTKPLNELRQIAEALSRGELNVDIAVDRTDEIGILAQSFSVMRNSIRQTIKKLEKTNLTLEERERWLHALVKALPDWILLFNWDGRVLDTYTTEQKALVLNPNDMLGKLLHDLHPKEQADTALASIRKTIATGQGVKFEYSLEGTNGPIWFESHTSRIGDEDGINGQVVWVARDITYRKQIEQSLTQAKEKAEDVSLRLRELDKTKSALVSSVSHELRTPLTSLLGFSKLIMKNFSKNFWPLAKGDHALLTKGSQIIENLNILIHEGDRLSRLINDVLDLNKIEMGYTLWREDRINLTDLTQNAIDAVSGQFNDNLDLDLVTEIQSDLPDIVADKDRLMQVLLNLLTNAAKFTTQGTVTLRVTTLNATLVRFEVQDTGTGIPEDEIERIFDIFHQVGEHGPADSKPGGAGLGLAICRDIIKHYEGVIWAESEMGKGSIFFIELPI